MKNGLKKNEYAYQSELDAVKLFMPKFEKVLEVGIGTRKFTFKHKNCFISKKFSKIKFVGSNFDSLRFYN